ncbi:MAG: cyclase family protein [Chloroflexota bacterium]
MTQIIDLTLTAYHGLRGVEIFPNTSVAQEGFNTTNLHLYSHAGTHLDAPRHFIDEGKTLEELDIQKCVGPALVVDLSHKEPRDLITVADLGERAAEIGPGSRVLLYTGWDQHAELPDYRTHFPRISLELANWFAQKGIWLVGMEMPSVASLQDYEELSTVHRALLGAEIVIVECLTNLDKLPAQVHFTALPMKILGGDGSPVRAIAAFER